MEGGEEKSREKLEQIAPMGSSSNLSLLSHPNCNRVRLASFHYQKSVVKLPLIHNSRFGPTFFSVPKTDKQKMKSKSDAASNDTTSKRACFLNVTLPFG